MRSFNGILLRRTPVQSRTPSSGASSSSQDNADFPTASQSPSSHHHIKPRHLGTALNDLSSASSSKKRLYFQWMTALMVVIFVSTLSTFRWSRSAVASMTKNDQYFAYYPTSNKLPLYAASSPMIHYPSSVMLSGLPSSRIHAPLPEPPKQRPRRRKKGEKPQDQEEGPVVVLEVVKFKPDYGGLNVRMMEDDEVPRIPYRNGDDLRNSYMEHGEGDDEVDAYFLVDDDVAANPYIDFDDDKINADEQQCRRPAWTQEMELNCNTFHEFDFPTHVRQGQSKHLGAGSFRDVYVAETENDDKFVFKKSSWRNAHGAFNYEDYHFVRKDGIIAAQLQPHPLLVDTYGFCQLSLFGEYMPRGNMMETAIPKYKKCRNMTDGIEKHKELVMMNDLTGTQKLEYALQMAESVAVLNNYEHGVIVHDDIQLVQFLLAPGGKLKLNDFNRMEPMFFDEANQEYCRYRNNPGHGPWRAPEEYFDWPLDEKIDIYSLGNMFYSMLTGMYPFYHECKSKEVQRKVKHRETPYIDPRWKKHSFAEAALVNVIRKCWAFHAVDRIDIGSMIVELREAVQENQRRRREYRERRQRTKEVPSHGQTQ